MTAVAPVQERAVLTRLIILQAGEHVVRRDGAFRATTAAVAREAFVSIGTFYRYFPDMPSLLDELGYVAVKKATT